MKSNKMKRTIQLLVVAALPAMSQVAEAGKFFDFRTPAQTSGKAGTAVSPAFTYPSQGFLAPYSDMHITGLRVAGVHDWVKPFVLGVTSLPNPAGQVTHTQTCRTEFRAPLTGAIVYQTPNQVQASALYNPLAGWAWSQCAFTPINQAANPRGLLAEMVGVRLQLFAVLIPTTNIKLRVMDVGTGLVKWAAAIISTVALGDPGWGQFVDDNADGTDDLELFYLKNVTPVGYNGYKQQVTRVVRNGATGAVLSQVSWVDTY